MTTHLLVPTEAIESDAKFIGLFRQNCALAFAIFITVAFSGCRPAISPSTDFSIRLASETPTAGMTETVLKSSGDTVFLDSKDIVTGPDFTNVRISEDETGRPCLSFELNKEAASRMNTATKDNIGGMMVLVIDGVAEAGIPVTSAFSGAFEISGSFTREEINDMYRAVTGYDL